MIKLSIKEIEEIVFRRFAYGSENHKHNTNTILNIANETLEALKHTLLLQNLQFTKINPVFEYTFDNYVLLGKMIDVGVVNLYVNNILIHTIREGITIAITTINNSPGISKDTEFENDLEFMKEFSKDITFSYVVYTVIHTIIHECFHMHSADNYYKYRNDKEYNKYVEQNIEYSTFKFMENNDIFKYLAEKYGCSELQYGEFLRWDKEELTDIPFLKEINLNNQISLVYKVMEALLPANQEEISKSLDLIREGLYDEVYTVVLDFKYQGNTQRFILYQNNMINWFAIQMILNTPLHSFKLKFHEYSNNGILIEFDNEGQMSIMKPALIPIMRRVSDDEFKS